ncbi:hypothetical protein AVL50_08270 [Flammeovirga sp. SJP92]|nr:hypothetical protein AVL50_08270 [Flammeovirga sp. SJP92]
MFCFTYYATTAQTIYYSKTNGNFDSFSTWASNSDGTGIEPTSITGNHFVILAAHTVTITDSDTESIHTLEVAGTLKMAANATLRISNDYYYYQSGYTDFDPTSLITFNNSSNISVIEGRNSDGSYNMLQFSNLSFEKGGNSVVVNDSPMNIDGNFTITNTEFDSKNVIYLSGHLSIDSESKYSTEANNDLILDGTGAQRISVPSVTDMSSKGNPAAQFSDVRFREGGSNIISEGFYATGTVEVYKDEGATLSFESGDYSLKTIRVRDVVSNSGTALTFNGGNVYMNNNATIEHYNTEDNTLVGTIDMGTVNFIAEDANLYFGGSSSDGDIITFTGNVTVSNSETLIIRTNTVLNSNGGTLTVNDDSRVYIEGATPPSFAMHTIAVASNFYYRTTDDITLLAIQYGNLRLYNASKKTINEDLVVMGDLGVYDDAHLIVSPGKTLTIHENIENRSEEDDKNPGTIDATNATITMVVNDANRTIALSNELPDEGDNIYKISNFNIEVGAALTANRTLSIYNKLDIDVLTITNSSGSLASLLVIDLQNDSSDLLDVSTSITQGDFTKIRTKSSHSTFLTAPSTVAIDQTHAFIEFSGGSQNIPSITYGNLEFSGNGNKTLSGDITVNGKIETIGGSSVLMAGYNTINIYGDWKLNNAGTDHYEGIEKSTVIFHGTSDQVINDATFGHLIFNSTGNVTILGPISVFGDMILRGGVDESTLLTVTANENIDLKGNWIENATSKFTQTNGSVRFCSESSVTDQTVIQNSLSEFKDVTLSNDPSIKTVFNTKVKIGGDLRMESERGSLEITDDLTLKGHFYNIGAGNAFTQAVNANFILSGSSLQNFRVDDAAKATFSELVSFSGEGMKVFQGNSTYTFDKGISIKGSIVDGNNKTINIKGDWLNNDGLFKSTNIVNFNGGKTQSVQSTTFYKFSIQETGTVVNLNGNIVIDQFLQDAYTTLNTDGYTIICANTWTGDGTFTHGNGTVTFTGQSSEINETDAFYTINSALTADEILKFNNDLTVVNDFTISLNSRVNISNNNLTIGGDLLSDGDIYNVNTFTFNGVDADRTYQIKNGLDRGNDGTPVDNNNTDFMIDPSVNTTYQLISDFRMTGSKGDFTVNVGKFDLNGYSLEQTNNNKQVIVKENAELIVGAGSALQLTGSDAQPSLLGEALSTITIVGDDNNYALIEGYKTNTYHILIDGLLSAKNYKITDLRGDGLQFGQNSSLASSPNNLTNGLFINGTNNSNASITIASGATLTTTTIDNVTFGQGPDYAVANNSTSIGDLTFYNAKGCNKEVEDDISGKIIWSFESFIEWTGATSTDWHTESNWAGGVKPTKTNNVVIPTGLTNYPVIDDSTGRAKRIDIQDGATLTVEERLEAYDGIFINYGGTLTGAVTNGDSIVVFGDWINEGTFTANTSPVKFAQEDGAPAKLISFIPGQETYTSLLIDGKEHTILQSDNTLNVVDITIKSGIYDVSDTDIKLSGDWKKEGGTFEYRNSDLLCEGTAAIYGGDFYNIIVEDNHSVTLHGNITAHNKIDLDAATASFNAGEYLIYIKGEFDNDHNSPNFSHTGTIIFGGAGQDIKGQTTFGNVIFQGTSKKSLLSGANITVNGDLTILDGISVTLEAGSSLTGTGVFTMTGGSVKIRDVSNYPAGFSQYQITGGTFDYDEGAQTIGDFQYYNLHIDNGAKTLNGDINVTNQFRINADDSDVYETSLNVNGKVINIGSSLLIFDTRTNKENTLITWNSGTLRHYGGNWSLPDELTSYHHLILEGIGSKTLNSDITVKGDFEVEDGVTFNQGSSDAYFKVTGVSGSKLKLGVNSRWNVYPQDEDDIAFASNFDMYNVSKTSNTYVNTAFEEDCIINTDVAYGNLYLREEGYVDLHENLVVLGNLDERLNEEGAFDINSETVFVGGNLILSTIDFRSGGTLYLNGDTEGVTQTVDLMVEGLTLPNLTLTGASQKRFDRDDYTIEHDIVMASNADVYISRSFDFWGENWTSDNTTTLTSIKTLRVNRDGDSQTINFGNDNTIGGLKFLESSTKTIVCPLDIDDELTTLGGQVNFGAYTHSIAASAIDLGTEDITSNANFILNGDNQQLPEDFSVKNLTLSNSGSKTITGNLTAYDIIAIDNTTLVPQNEASIITVKGNWNFEFGRYSPKKAKVVFDGADANAEYTIFQNGNTRMFEVQFLGTNKNTYKLTDDLYTYTSVNIEQNVTVDVNGHVFYVGARTDLEEYPSLASKMVENLNIRGELLVSKGGSVQLNAHDGDGKLANRPTITVENGGHLSVVGEEGLLSKLSSDDSGSDNHRLVVDIQSGGKISAKYYEFRNLDHGGFKVDAGATVDDTNNFSEGVFSGMSTNNSLGVDRIYLSIEAIVNNAIENVTFDYNGDPNDGVDLYNVRRMTATKPITFGGIVAGSIQGENYELDGEALINWPPSNDKNWLGITSSDWFTASNWEDNAVPELNIHNVIIPSKASPTTFYPIISGALKAECRNLIIQGGRLTLDSDLDGADPANVALNVGGDIQLESGLITVTDNELVVVGQNHSVTNNGSFLAGSGTLKLAKSSGTVVLDQNNSSFYNLEISGGATVALQSQLKVEGAFSISNQGGITLPNNHDVIFNGDVQLSRTASFDTQSDGWIYLQGTSTQNLKNATFKRARFQGAEYVVEDSLIITNRAYLEKGALMQKNENSSFVFYNRVDVENNEFSFVLYDGGGTHYLRDANWYGYGATSNLSDPSGNGSSNFIFQDIGGNINIQGNKTFFDSVTLAANSITLYADMELTTLDATNTDIYTQEKQITGKHTGEFILGSDHSLYLEGADNFPKGFGNYTFDQDSRTFYRGGLNQSIHTKEEVRDESDVLQYILPIFYGHLYLEGEESVKTISTEGELIVRGNLRINQTTFNTNNENVKISKDLEHNYQNSSLVYGTSKFTFDGTEDQIIELLNGRENKFYDINVNKPASSTLTVTASDITVEGDLVVQNGIFSLGSNTATLNKNLLVNNGTLAETGTYYMKASGTGAIIRTNDSRFRGLRINGKNTTVYTLTDELTITDNYDLELEQGTLNTSGATINIGNNGQFNIATKGSYVLGESGQLKMGNNSTLNVAGNINVVGTATTPAIIESTETGFNYSFNVEGNINARYYNISGMSTNGIFIKTSGTIDKYDQGNNFSDGTLTNYKEGGVALKIENNQAFEAQFDGDGNYTSGAIENVNFIQSALRGTANVAKDNSTTGRIDFYNANGQLSGSNFERDPNNLINWYGPDVYTWTGAENTNWYNANNWSSSNGGIPTADNDVVIEATTNQPIIDGSEIARVNNLTLKTGSLLLINSSTSGVDLVINGNVELNGQMKMESVNDEISFKSNWVVNPTGTFTHGGGKLTANGSGVQQIDNAGLDFGDLTIGETSVVILNLNGDEDILGDFTVLSGASIELNASLKTLSISGNMSVQGGIITNNNTINLKGDGDGVADVFTVSIPSSSNVIELLTINADDASDEYELRSNIYTSTSVDVVSGTFDANGHTIYFQGGATNKINVNGGTLDLTSSTLVMNNETIFELNDGALIMVNDAKVTSQNSVSDYSFSLFGGSFTGDSFTFEYMDEEGIVFNGVTINTVSKLIDHNNDPSDADQDFDVLLPFGIFQNGQSNGRLIHLVSYTIAGTPTAGNSNLDYKFYNLFLNGPSITNVRNNSGTIVYFSDAKGSIPGDNFEDEVVANSIVWEATKNIYTWVGDEGNFHEGLADWTEPSNWVLIGGTEPTVYPGEETEHATNAIVIIPEIDSGNRPPVLLDTKQIAIFSLRVEPLAGLVIKSSTDPSVLDRSVDGNYEMIIKDEFSILSNDVQKGYVDFIRSLVRVEGRIQNDGIFKQESSIMVLKPAAGDEINLVAGENYNDLYIDGSNDPVINLTGDVNVQGLFNMDDGTLNVGGNTFNAKGNFELSSAVNLNYDDDFTLVLDGVDQTLKLNNHNLRNIKFGGTGTKTVSGSLVVEGDFTIEGLGTTVAFGSNSLDLKGNWMNEYGNGNFTMSDSGSVTFSGTSIQTLTGYSSEETFINLIINNSNGIDSELDINISNGLTLTNGILKAPHVILASGVGGPTGVSSSTRSFIYGKVTAKSIPGGVNAWYEFPVGSQSTWARAAINTQNVFATHDYSVKYTTEDRGENLLIDDSADGIAMEVSQFIWNITNGSSDADGINIRLYLEDLSHYSLATSSLRKLIHYYDKSDGNGINWYEETSTFTGDENSGYVEASGIMHFSDFGSTLEEYINPADELPVELTYFQGSVDKEGNVLLEWETASEVNASHFDIERSFNGKSYEKIGSRDASGNSNVSIQYNYEDKIKNKLVFYRLKQVDFDGQDTYYGPVTLVLDHNNETIASAIELFVFPNPLEEDNAVITISGLTADEAFEGQITTLTGTSVYTIKSEADANGIHNLTLNTSDWKTGMYILKIMSKSGKTAHLKLMK